MSERKKKMKKRLFSVLLILAATASCISQNEKSLCSIHSSCMVVDDLGNSYVVWTGWQSSISSNYEIYWVRVDASGNSGEVEKISTRLDSVGRDNNDPQIALDVVGNSYVVWQGNDGNDNKIYWAKIDTLGNPGQVEKISTYSDNQENHDFCPQIAVDSSGNSYVVWEGNDGNYSQIYWVKVGSSGNPGQVEKISTYREHQIYWDQDPHIAIDASGNSYIIWEAGQPDHDTYSAYDIYWIRMDVLGNCSRIMKIYSCFLV